MQILIFYLNQRKYGIELQYCKEIDLLEKFTILHYDSQNFKSYIEGITNLRGEIITLINLKKLFQLEETSIKEGNLIIRLTVKKAKVSILVDEVFDIISIDNKSKDYSKGHINPNLIPYIDYTILYNHEPILVINVMGL
ncbi:MAG: chemotaxis protein CheW [Leptospiraceae bacterium]|nr:chemotaxis protein CheW [Leptospiraceae bacterium]MDW7975798.1 chemotaxis protein CheW [Leptospiraceae bacterium]